MTKEQAIELAKQAGFQKFLKPADRPEMICWPDDIERFATLVRNAALEKCAKTILEHSHPPETQRLSDTRMSFYAAIRNLKEPTP